MTARVQIDRARAVRIEDEIARRGIELRGGVNRCGPCPVCGGTDRFSINTRKQVFNCRGCGKSGDVIALVQYLDGVGFLDAIAHLAGPAPQRTDCSIRKQREDKPQDDEELPNGTQNLAVRIWHESKPPKGSGAEAYLYNRGLTLPENAREVIRFHPNCFFGAERFPAMICLVRNILTDEPQAIHRTATTAYGFPIKRAGKTLRMSLGEIAGGAIKLDPDENVEQGLCIGEGVETCLAGRQMGMRPVWSVVSTSGIEKFPILPVVNGLHIFKENDPNGASVKAVEACARRWYETGRDVVITEPDIGKDLNDELLERVG